MENIYNDGSYLTKNPSWHQEDAPFKALKIVELLEKNSIPISTIAEIGCGSGEILVQLEPQLKHITHFVGFDISKDAINIAKTKETKKINFELRDLTDKNEKSFYDLLLVIDVIEHIDNYFSFLKGISSKSKYTLFHIPLDMCLWTLFREKMLIESKNRVGHIHNFTEEFILNILSDYGFEIVDKMYTEPVYKTKNIKQKIVRIAQKILFKINKKFCTKTLGGYSILVLTKNKN
jgi:predicted TPR repeat methyltransferase